MAKFVRVISNDVCESLVEKGILDTEAPDQKPSLREQLLSKIPVTLHLLVENLLEATLLEWNETLKFMDNGVPFKGSNIAQLLSKFVVQSKTFKYLKGSDQFQKAVTKKVPFPVQTPSCKVDSL